MEKTKDELLAELDNLRLQYSELEARHSEETSSLKKTEEELQHRLMFLEGVANSTIDGFLVVNPYGQKILQNQRTIELWKIPHEITDDPDGKKQVSHVMHMVVNPKQFVDEIDFLREHPEDKTRDELELIDGTILDRYSSPVIGPDGKNYGRIWTFHDITELKKLEKQLMQLNADKDHFISILAHDLRSPFNSLLGFSELLKKELKNNSTERAQEMVESIYYTARKTHELLEDTLLWANIQSKKVTYHPVIINLSDVISEVSDILDPIARAKNIVIEPSLNFRLLVNTDVYMLKAILRNLVSNAIKFTNQGGKIKIVAFHENSFTTISVEDNGIGVKPEVLEKLFKISNVQSTRGTANEKGSGLGLVLCKEFVEKHRGKIWMESVINKGTKVSFTIPDPEVNLST